MFKYPLFISYPRIGASDGSESRYEKQDTGVIAFTRKLRDFLNIEFEAHQRDFKVLLDDDFLAPTQDLDSKIAEMICKSYCYVVVFTPSYISDSHKYCCRELIAIQEHERKRFETLRSLNIEVEVKSLVIPIILRGKSEQFPRIFCCDTPMSFNVSEKSLWIQSGFQHAQSTEVYELNKIASDIAKQVILWKEICESYSNWIPPKNCFEISLPNKEDDKVNQLINNHKNSSSFPKMINTF